MNNINIVNTSGKHCYIAAAGWCTLSEKLPANKELKLRINENLNNGYCRLSLLPYNCHNYVANGADNDLVLLHIYYGQLPANKITIVKSWSKSGVKKE